MVAVPTELPLTMPEELTEAMEVLLLDQVPPETVSDKVVVVPEQRIEAPAIREGAVTVTVTEL